MKADIQLFHLTQLLLCVRASPTVVPIVRHCQMRITRPGIWCSRTSGGVINVFNKLSIRQCRLGQLAQGLCVQTSCSHIR